jgi:pantothenate synthetase
MQFAYADDLAPLKHNHSNSAVMMFVAVRIGKVRLIDNMLIYG